MLAALVCIVLYWGCGDRGVICFAWLVCICLFSMYGGKRRFICKYREIKETERFFGVYVTFT